MELRGARPSGMSPSPGLGPTSPFRGTPQVQKVKASAGRVAAFQEVGIPLSYTLEARAPPFLYCLVPRIPFIPTDFPTGPSLSLSLYVIALRPERTRGLGRGPAGGLALRRPRPPAAPGVPPSYPGGGCSEAGMAAFVSGEPQGPPGAPLWPTICRFA